MINVPMSWVRAGLPSMGTATYRLTVKTGGAERLTPHIPEIYDAGVVY
jgi:hypothetical protein